MGKVLHLRGISHKCAVSIFVHPRAPAVSQVIDRYTEQPATGRTTGIIVLVPIKSRYDGVLQDLHAQVLNRRTILGQTEVENFHVSAGWGTYGFKAAPIVGKTLAELVATNRTPKLIAPFALERFYEDKLVSELAAAAVSH